jgi:glycerol-3-phosphate acyltransferase PlsY
MTRVFGWVAGVATLAFDVLKAVAAMMIGRRLLGDVGVCLGGMAVMLGHCFPLFHHFKGGKGIATGAAIGFMIDWRVGTSIVAAFLIGALISKKVSVGSLTAALTIVPSTWIFAPRPSMIALSVFACVLAITRHSENIKRLKAGTEPDFRAGKQPERNPVSIDGGRLRDIHLAEPLQGFRGVFHPNLLGRFRFGYAFCHFTPKDR